MRGRLNMQPAFYAESAPSPESAEELVSPPPVPRELPPLAAPAIPRAAAAAAPAGGHRLRPCYPVLHVVSVALALAC